MAYGKILNTNLIGRCSRCHSIDLINNFREIKSDCKICFSCCNEIEVALKNSDENRKICSICKNTLVQFFCTTKNKICDACWYGKPDMYRDLLLNEPVEYIIVPKQDIIDIRNVLDNIESDAGDIHLEKIENWLKQ